MFGEELGGNFHGLRAPGIAHPKGVWPLFECMEAGCDTRRLEFFHGVRTTDSWCVLFTFDEEEWGNTGANMGDWRGCAVEFRILGAGDTEEGECFRIGGFAVGCEEILSCGHGNAGLDGAVRFCVWTGALEFGFAGGECGERGEVTAGGPADETYTFRVDLQSCGMSSEESDGCLAIMEGRGIASLGGEAIGDQRGHKAPLGETFHQRAVGFNLPLGPPAAVNV